MSNGGQLAQLTDVLFVEMERLSNMSLDDERIDKEIARARNVASLATNINTTFKTALDATRLASEGCVADAAQTTVNLLMGGE